MKLTSQGVRDLNLIGPKPRTLPTPGYVWHDCTRNTERVIDDETGRVLWICRRCKEEV